MGCPLCPNPKETKFQNNVKFKNNFVHKLFYISPALTDTMRWLQAQKKDVVFHMAKSVSKKYFFLSVRDVGEQVSGHVNIGAHDPFCEHLGAG